VRIISESLTPKVISILRAMHSNMKEWYYTRELAKLAKVSPWSVSRQFSRLVKEGMVNERLEGRERFYSLNLANARTRKICELFETEKRETSSRRTGGLHGPWKISPKRSPTSYPRFSHDHKGF